MKFTSLRQQRIAQALTAGLSDKEIAAAFDLAVSTVKKHISNLRKQLKIPASRHIRIVIARRLHNEQPDLCLKCHPAGKR